MSRSKKRQKWQMAAAIAATMGGMAGSALATDNLWIGTTSSDWNDATNWSLGRVPVNPSAAADGFDDAVVNTIVPNIATITADIPVPRDIIVASGAGSIGRVDQTAGTATTGGGNWFYVGRDAGNGTYNLANTATTGGTLTGFGASSGSIDVGGGTGHSGTDGRMYIGGTEFGAAGAVGTFNVNTTGTITVRNDMNVGTDGGTGVMNVDAGTITTGGWNFIGKRANTDGANGTFNMSGGTLTNSGRTYVGQTTATGVMNLSGGTYTQNDHFIIGEGVASHGTVNVTAPASTLSIGGELWIGQGAGGNGAMNVSAGMVTTNNWIAVGREGATGVLNVSGTGTVQKNGGGHITIGTGAGGNGTVNLSGGGTLTTNGDFILGENDPTSVGLVNQTGGTVKVAGTLDVQRTGIGTYNLSGGTLMVDTNVDAATGTFSFTGGKLTRSNGGAVTFTGNLKTGGTAATIGLDSGKTLAVTGTLDVSAGSGFDLTGDTIPSRTAAVLTGSIGLGTDGGIVGTFGPGLTSISGLNNLGGATFISEAQGEGALFNSGTDSVFWLQEAGGALSLQYSLAPAVPEPGMLGIFAIAGVGLLRRRRKA